MEGEPRVNKPIYEIPLTDPGAPPFGLPGTAGAMPAPRGVLPPEAMATTDFSQLPPPSAAPQMPGDGGRARGGAAGPQVPQRRRAVQQAAPQFQHAAPQVPDAAPFAPPAAATADFDVPPPPAAESLSGAIPGFTPAPAYAPVLPIPSFEERPPLGVVPPPAPPTALQPVIEDEAVRVARSKADPELLAALQEVLRCRRLPTCTSRVGATPMIRVDGALQPGAGARRSGTARRSPSALLQHPEPGAAARSSTSDLELDFAFTLSANARFRVNFYQQRGAIGGAFRLIPTEIKPLDDARRSPTSVAPVRQARRAVSCSSPARPVRASRRRSPRSSTS